MENEVSGNASPQLVIKWITLDEADGQDLKFRFALAHEVRFVPTLDQAPVRLPAGTIFWFNVNALGYSQSMQVESIWNQYMEVAARLALGLTAAGQREGTVDDVPF